MAEDGALSDWAQRAASAAGDGLINAVETEHQLNLCVTVASWASLAELLKNDPDFALNYPADLCAYEQNEYFHLWYRLSSLETHRTVIIDVLLESEFLTAPSLLSLWPGLNWHERECFDLYGIRFEGHPDQADSAQMRILLPEDWEGHPFRSDYEPVFSGNPLHGPQERN